MVENIIGGKLQGISLDAFLQMAQMEQITCTLSVVSGSEKGLLFLQNGKLISAETNGLKNIDAAHRIISWEKTFIEIQESCSKTVDEINKPLMNILMEAMRLRDDAKNHPPAAPSCLPEKQSPQESSTKTPGPAASVTSVQTNDPPEKQPDIPKINTAKKKRTDPRQETTAPPDPSGHSRRLPWKYIVIGLVIALAAGGLTVHFLSSSKRTRLDYETLLRNAENTDTLEQKIALLSGYDKENPGGAYTADINHRIKTIQEKRAKQEFETIEETASRLAAEGNIKTALAEYETYLEQAEAGQHQNKAAAAIKTLTDQLENREFEEMQAAALAQGPERVSIYRAFLEKYPESPHRDILLALISNMEDEYFIFLERQILENEKSENWSKGLELGQHFLEVYPESDHAEVMTKLLVKYRNELQAAQAFEYLLKRSELLGTNHEAALAVFSDYLKAYPGTPAREKIEGEMNRLIALMEEKRLMDAVTLMAQKVTESGSRFIVENNETLLDTKTKLMWCLLDSQAAMNKCLPYKEATAYVSSLNAGGYDDWRIPTPEELSALYQKQPSFPADDKEWYWSSKNQKRYGGQWIVDVEVIDPKQLDGKEAITRESWQCGTVRAVRKAEKK